MIAYADSSVLLRVLLGSPGQVKEWKSVETCLSSELARVECLRTIDRLRLRGATEDQVSRLREATFRLLERLHLAPVSSDVLSRASAPFPVGLGTLDAIHLASALLWQEGTGEPLGAFLTHDVEQGRAARAMGLRVLGP